MLPKNASILPALLYADIFDYPLTKEELTLYHLAPQKRGLNLMPEQTGTYFHLPGRQAIVALRQKRLHLSQLKLKKAQAIALQLSKVSTVLGIFVTGNLAMGNADENDDIDLLVITKTNTLWVTRFIITLILEMRGVRRRPFAKTTSNQMCINMYLDEAALAVPPAQRNLYTAHEVVQVKPLVNQANIYERFLAANRWISRYLPNFPLPSNSPAPKPHPANPSLFESLAYLIQRLYMKRKMTRETITPHAALFHPRDTALIVLQQYQAKLSGYNQTGR